MPIYKVSDNRIIPIERTTFGQQGLRERQNLQAMLKAQIDIIAPDTLVVAEEFGDWEDSRRRIDLLGIDKDANLVVIELKHTEDGGHMELQAIRYAAMISTLTFSKLVTIYERYLSDNNIEADPTDNLLEFLEWTEPDDDQFAQEVKILLASAEFSKELTTSVMWLNDFGLDIRCVRMHPYNNGGETLLDVQTVIPIPEVADYQVRIREKRNFPRSLAKVSQSFAKAEKVFFASLSATLAELCGILLTHLAKNAQDFSKQSTKGSAPPTPTAQKESPATPAIPSDRQY